MRWIGIVVVLFLASCATTQEKGLEKRVQLLEQKLSNRSAMQLLQQVDQMQREMRAMQGQLEEAQHLIQRMQESQRKQYLDLDARLRALEGGNPTADPGYSGVPVIPSPVADTTSPQHAPSSAPQPTDSANASAEDEVQSYRKAYETLQAGHYDAAVDAFSEFLQRYPGGEYADNAYYWLGEAYYVKRDFNAARQAFRQVVDKFQNSPKVPDAMLKLAYIDLELGQDKKAREALQEIVRRFPGTRAAKLARQRLIQQR